MSNDYIIDNYAAKISALRVPSKEDISYKVEEEGIVKVIDVSDQYNEHMYAINILILPKEIFIEAYNTYINDIET